jgi:hypothetical protein
VINSSGHAEAATNEAATNDKHGAARAELRRWRRIRTAETGERVAGTGVPPPKAANSPLHCCESAREVLHTSRVASWPPLAPVPLYQSGTSVLAAAFRVPGFARLNPPPRRARFDLRGCIEVSARARTAKLMQEDHGPKSHGCSAARPLAGTRPRARIAHVGLRGRERTRRGWWPTPTPAAPARGIGSEHQEVRSALRQRHRTSSRARMARTQALHEEKRRGAALGNAGGTRCRAARAPARAIFCPSA